jgi:hypothetical protein
MFAAVGGQKLGEDGAPLDYHAALGALGLIILADGERFLKVVVKNSLYEDG